MLVYTLLLGIAQKLSGKSVTVAVTNYPIDLKIFTDATEEFFVRAHKKSPREVQLENLCGYAWLS